jgi:hypothetical protein
VTTSYEILEWPNNGNFGTDLRGAAMNRQKGIHGCGTDSLSAILTVVANSPISAAVLAHLSARLPFGFEDADINIQIG